MKTLITLLSFWVTLFCNNAFAAKLPIELFKVWQFPDTAVWIDIRKNGDVYQCRIDTDGKTTYLSKGKVVDKSIRWEKLWGSVEISLEKGNQQLSLTGKYGTFSYQKADRPMPNICQNPLIELF